MKTPAENDRIELAKVLWPNPAPRTPIEMCGRVSLKNSVGYKSLRIGTINFIIPRNEPLIDLLNRIYHIGVWAGQTESATYPSNDFPIGDDSNYQPTYKPNHTPE